MLLLSGSLLALSADGSVPTGAQPTVVITGAWHTVLRASGPGPGVMGQQAQLKNQVITSLCRALPLWQVFLLPSLQLLLRSQIQDRSFHASLHRLNSPATRPPLPSLATLRAPPRAEGLAAMEPTEMDEDVKLPSGGPALVFGTIKPGDSAAAVAAGVAAGNIMRQEADAEVLELPEVSEGVISHHGLRSTAECRVLDSARRARHHDPPVASACHLPHLRRLPRSTCASRRS